MSHYIPVFAYPLAPEDFQPGWTPYEALATAPELLWSATSRNWWFQNFLENQLDTFAGHDSLRYLLQELVLVRAPKLPPERRTFAVCWPHFATIPSFSCGTATATFPRPTT